MTASLENVNDPNNKYSFQKSQAKEFNSRTGEDGHGEGYEDMGVKDSSANLNELQFFNYHELMKTPWNNGGASSSNTQLVINHFPNTHVPIDSPTFQRTRVIRIPRIYTKAMSEWIPQFSDIIPGKEPAAIRKEEEEDFKIYGEFDRNVFGITSVTPLVPKMIAPRMFQSIVFRINMMIFEAFDPYKSRNILEGFLDALSGSIFRYVNNKIFGGEYCKKRLLDLDSFIENDLNSELRQISPDLKIIPLRRTGYLSLDIQIPKESI